MRNKIGSICMVLGAVLVLAALSLFLWNQRENNEAGMSAEKILPQVMEQIKTPGAVQEPEEPSYPDPYDPTMTEVEIDGYAYVGPLLPLRSYCVSIKKQKKPKTPGLQGFSPKEKD